MEGRGISRATPRSDLISPKAFLMSWNVEAFEAVRSKTEDETKMLHYFSQKIKVAEETVKELAEVCGKQTLFCGSEPRNRLRLLEMKEVPEQVDLACVKHQVENLKRRHESETLKVSVARQMKYKVMDEYMAVAPPNQPSTSSIDEEFRVPEPNVILTVQIAKCRFQGDQEQKIPVCDTFLVLGSQPLTALRDKLKCSSDAVIAGDFSLIPDIDPTCLDKAGDIYKSSFFFIENTFYNDLRLSDNKDYSKPILSWASEHMPGTELKTGDMHTTTFFDLSLRLGHYYLFTHQGNCEHSVLFTDMRLLNSDDIQDVRQYPVLSITRTKNRYICHACSKFSAKWIVQDSPLIPNDPCLLCHTCLKTLLYNKDGVKVSNFKAYHFSDFYE